VKSLAGLHLRETALDRFGPVGDRRWLVTDPAGRFLTQREHPGMALIETALDGETLTLRRGDDTIDVPVPARGAPERMVRVWQDHTRARDAGDAAADWLSGRLGGACRLFYMPEDSVRLVDGLYARNGESVSFA